MKFPRKNNPVRLIWLRIYFAAGIAWLIGFLIVKISPLEFLKGYFSEISWCLGWGAIGIGAGLYNSRTDRGGNSSSHKHYILYFGFVWFIAALSAFVMFGNTIEKGCVTAYASAALVGLVVGFAGDKLAGKLLDLKKVQ